ncbi:TraG/TraD/VirD4 family protein [Lysinibacter sp. HNR]|uniref:type IV secretory system conjugative DNA transfer family protein n=1 Tax=Lysinibacter sp. HNR TaxID=3031408 RepID=UPI002434F38A|nr:TraG/TraD/VirD4 family protein [Lysinibacter sp. HNR]WGD37573.1 TraG/TraD/VirD4 family protein [Lysinibacter sp. HNR]
MRTGKVVVWCGFALVIFCLWGLIHLGNFLTPGSAPLPVNPLEMILAFMYDRAVWPAATTWLLILGSTIFLVGLVLWAVKPQANTRPRNAHKKSTSRMSSPSHVRRIQERARTRELAQLHPDLVGHGAPGLHLGKILVGDRGWVYQGFRQCSVHVWAPGRGKTFGEVVRHSYYAPGAYMLTMNKVDGIREVIALRQAAHPAGRIWVFDQQNIFRKASRPAFTINLLAGITNSEEAHDLAVIFETANVVESDKGDKQFDSQGRDFLAWCILAAAITPTGTLSDVFDWVSGEDFTTPYDILHQTGRHRGAAASLFGMSRQPDRTRGSVAASAQRMASPMVHDRLMQWVTPQPGIPEFEPDHFITSKDTLLMLSEESAGTVTAFVSALVEAVLNACKREAQRRGGRLPLPLVADLDECGNVVKLKKLPDWYTYFGSMGIVVSSYWQSKSQGVALFGESRWKLLWDSAGVKVYGGGSDDTEWLRMLAALFGKYDKPITTSQHSGGITTSHSSSTRETDVITVAELADLPEWHAVVRTSNGVSTMIKIIPSFEDPELMKILSRAPEINYV